jgi:hypothetical protein
MDPWRRSSNFEVKPVAKPVLRGGTAVAQDCSRTYGEHGRHPPPISCQSPVSDGIDTAVNAMQPSLPQSVPDRVATHTCVTQLPARNDSMLA